MSEMSNTDKLRELLDERGSIHRDIGDMTLWRDVNGVQWCATEQSDGSLHVQSIDFMTPEQAIAATVGPKVTEDTSDGWHSFKDLYHHRALLFSVIVHNYKDMCWKSKRHDDGKELDWNFIVGIDTPWGQASYHYGMEYWDMFDCKVLDKAPHYDGYTPEQSVERIARLVELDAATVGRSCASCPEMDNPDSYISHLQSALRWHDEHVPRPTNPLASCVVLQGKKPPEEVLFVKDEGGVTHYKPEVTRCIDCAHYEHHIIAGLCHKLGRAMNPSDFCSRSERKADK